MSITNYYIYPLWIRIFGEIKFQMGISSMYHGLKRKSKKNASKNNGKKGGRPAQDSTIYIELPEINLVILTPTQYDSLIEKYGYNLIKKALLILDNWLKTGGQASSKYVGKNNYAHFRSDGWLLNEARRLK